MVLKDSNGGADEYKFKARPVDPKILNSSGDLGVPRVAKAPPTKSREFSLSVSNRTTKVQAPSETPLFSSFSKVTTPRPSSASAQPKSARGSSRSKVLESGESATAAAAAAKRPTDSLPPVEAESVEAEATVQRCISCEQIPCKQASAVHEQERVGTKEGDGDPATPEPIIRACPSTPPTVEFSP